MSSDEEDYMSDKFLGNSKSDMSGIYKSRKLQHEIKLSTKRLRMDNKKEKSIKVLQKERLEEGLNYCLTPDNKGFALLSKMGYKVGDSLGKSSTSGIIEPIAINIKSDRQGLGRETAIKQLTEQQNKIRNQRTCLRNELESTNIIDFRNRMGHKCEEKLIEIELGKCQRACEKLDTSDAVDIPLMKWFWPQRRLEIEEESDDTQIEEETNNDDINEIEYTTDEKLKMLMGYMRTSYNYCNWCGIKYENTDDMFTNCPGDDKELH